MGLQWTFWLTAENEPARPNYWMALYHTACSPQEGQARDSPCFVCRALPMLHELEKPAVPHSTGASEVAKHPAGWRSAAGGAERWISFPAAVISPKLFKMFVFKKKTAFFSPFHLPSLGIE